MDNTSLSQLLKVKTEAKVMIVINVNTTDSPFNGSLGVLEVIATDDDGNIKSVIIKFDTEKAGAK